MNDKINILILSLYMMILSILEHILTDLCSSIKHNYTVNKYTQTHLLYESNDMTF